MLKNPNPNSITTEKRIPGYTLFGCTQKTTQTMIVIGIVAFIDFVKEFSSEVSMDQHVCSIEPYIFSLTEIDSRNELSEVAVSQTEFSY